ncbi:hypothetical protein [Humitalea rosea]|uniref:hypothetical protein n=1 Tax=Humitalea rosea TaxID=990373 RepID=UPI000DAD5938|nr:hypothetical protein [Humitalea rosea]
MSDTATALAAALSRRIDLRDADPAGLPADQALQRRVLNSYAQELAGMKPEEGVLWMLRRLSMLEARLLTVQAAQWQGATVLPYPAPVEPAPEPAIAPVVAEEIVLPTQMTLNLDEQLRREGFLRPEKASSGDSFCWIGPTPKAAIYLPRLRTPVEIRLLVLSTLVPDALEQVQLALDGGAWTTVRVERQGRITTLIAAPPPGQDGGAATMRLDIDAIRTASPASINGGDDRRQLSIAIWRVELVSI